MTEQALKMQEREEGRKSISLMTILDAARTIIKSSQIEDEDEDDEEITFDGKPVVKYTAKSSSNASKTPMPDLSSLAVPAVSSTSRTSSNPPTTSSSMSSSSSFGGVNSAMTFGHSRSQSLTLGSSVNIEPRVMKPQFVPSPMSSTTSLEELDDFSHGSKRKQMSASDIDKMQQEIQSLRRSLLGAKRDRWVKLPVDDTLRRIMKGEGYSLELYRSLEDKLELLDKAVRLHDGNAITAAVLFLQSTVTKTIFNRELLCRPQAADHYLSYLKAHFDFAEYINVLVMLGRTEEAAAFKFKLALPTTDVGLKISKLKDSLRSHFSADPHLSQESSFVQEYIDLLERQRPVDESDANLEATGRSQMFRDIPRKVSLIGMPVVTTLYYCCLYHYDLSENSLGSPAAIKKRHQISDKQYLWTAISARAKVRHWKDIEIMLTTKGWFGGTKMKSVIGFDKIVNILHRNSAPPEILEKYLSLIDDVETRIELAKKVSCHKAIMDTYVATKNRPELEAYATKFDRYSKEGLYAHDILNSSTIRWK
ncbi:spermatogenesis-defective protein 39 homolog isoform X2 [Aplysia californica]|uniref:Spermatogenesis-defective protein 39 homolog isoform X2 n=1 Tax=Aplysia californica TaxID=6500 RepID=A0ABM1VV68_APLCA|nr:spermatogenesis-defective protein 39 homolog isoform X2 [Aplysia californica]